MRDGTTNTDAVRSEPRRDGATERATLSTALDRRAIAAVVQVVPSDRYGLAFRLPGHDGLDRMRGRIGDLTGTEVLAMIEGGQMCLCLADVGALLAHDHPDLADEFPEFAASGERIHHGLVIASPHLTLAVPPGSRNGAIRVLEGSLTLRLDDPDEARAGRPRVRLGPGDGLDRIGAGTTRLEVGDRLLVALTRCESAQPAGARVGGIVSRLRRRFGRTGPEARRPTLIEAVFAPHARTQPAPDAAAPVYRLVRNRPAIESGSDTGD